MELKQIRYFHQVSIDKSFLKASKNLFISQQALSKSIRQLENEFGIDLLVRNYSGVELTKTGQIFLEKTLPVMQQVDETIALMYHCAAEKRDTIAVGFVFGSLSGGSAIPLSLLWAFQTQHPETELQIIQAWEHDCEEMVLNEKIDIACVVNPSNPALFDNSLLRRDQLKLVLSVKHPLAKNTRVVLKQLANEQFILPPIESRASQALIVACEQAGFTPKLHQGVYLDVMYELVSDNKGVSFLPVETMVMGITKKIKVIYIDPPVQPKIDLYIISKKKRLLSKNVINFRDYLLKQYESYRG
ncbi:MAG: LysR family transcriptional regulator [Firmicutes bacterium]|nr:LysR family transcriptional regulator [Bacillota bacterium]